MATPGWLIPKLLDDGAQVSILQSSVGDAPEGRRPFFFRVEMPLAH
jgi:hypothetical protein